jgi:hypothetical protein
MASPSKASACKQLLELDGGCVAIHETQHSKLITALRTAAENGGGVLDKEATSRDDLLDAFRLCSFGINQKLCRLLK